MKFPVIDVGHGNVVALNRVVAIVSPGSLSITELMDEAKGRFKLVDATKGKRTKSIIITDSDHVILSPRMVETLVQRAQR